MLVWRRPPPAVRASALVEKIAYIRDYPMRAELVESSKCRNYSTEFVIE
jgi:hypothetical protein